MKSILDKKIEELGKEVVYRASGMDSRAKQSNIYHAIVKCGFNPSDEDITFCVLMGGRAGKSWNDGYKFAIIKL